MTKAAVMSRPPASNPPQTMAASPGLAPEPTSDSVATELDAIPLDPALPGAADSHIVRPFHVHVRAPSPDQRSHHGGLSLVPRRERGARARGGARPPEAPAPPRAVRVAGGPLHGRRLGRRHPAGAR